ncbi:hypothetical protein BU15DRAFT_66462 [Melanogaster broomeanus]|nr:hypothetical protein BU15DRAFT_66462 [Melanogaster broomeanus]
MTVLTGPLGSRTRFSVPKYGTQKQERGGVFHWQQEVDKVTQTRRERDCVNQIKGRVPRISVTNHVTGNKACILIAGPNYMIDDKRHGEADEVAISERLSSLARAAGLGISTLRGSLNCLGHKGRMKQRRVRVGQGPLAPVLQPNPIHPALQRFGEQTETIATICASDTRRKKTDHGTRRVVDRRVTAWKQLPKDCLCRTSPSVHRDSPRFRALSQFSLLQPGARMSHAGMWLQSPPSEPFPASLPSLQGSHTPTLAAPARASSRQVLVSQSSPTLREVPAAADGTVSVCGTFVDGTRWFRRDMICRSTVADNNAMWKGNEVCERPRMECPSVRAQGLAGESNTHQDGMRTNNWRYMMDRDPFYGVISCPQRRIGHSSHPALRLRCAEVGQDLEDDFVQQRLAPFIAELAPERHTVVMPVPFLSNVLVMHGARSEIDMLVKNAVSMYLPVLDMHNSSTKPIVELMLQSIYSAYSTSQAVDASNGPSTPRMGHLCFKRATHALDGPLALQIDHQHLEWAICPDQTLNTSNGLLTLQKGRSCLGQATGTLIRPQMPQMDHLCSKKAAHAPNGCSRPGQATGAPIRPPMPRMDHSCSKQATHALNSCPCPGQATGISIRPPTPPTDYSRSQKAAHTLDRPLVSQSDHKHLELTTHAPKRLLTPWTGHWCPNQTTNTSNGLLALPKGCSRLGQATGIAIRPQTPQTDHSHSQKATHALDRPLALRPDYKHLKPTTCTSNRPLMPWTGPIRPPMPRTDHSCSKKAAHARTALLMPQTCHWHLNQTTNTSNGLLMLPNGHWRCEQTTNTLN